MGKALVLKNVNFATNKVTTVTLAENVPCTGISISQNTLSFSQLGTATLTATPTPVNTSDTVSWASSDTSVATVNDGVVTAVGLGSATITATCGNYSATCAVTVTVEITDFITLLHRMNSGTDLANGKDYVGTYTSDADVYKKKAMLLSGTVTVSGYKALSGDAELYNSKYPLIIPNNAKTIVVEGSGLSLTDIVYLDSNSHPTYAMTSAYLGCKVVVAPSYASASSGKCTFTIPSNVEGLDSFILTLTFASAIEELPSGTKISFAA